MAPSCNVGATEPEPELVTRMVYTEELHCSQMEVETGYLTPVCFLMTRTVQLEVESWENGDPGHWHWWVWWWVVGGHLVCSPSHSYDRSLGTVTRYVGTMTEWCDQTLVRSLHTVVGWSSDRVVHIGYMHVSRGSTGNQGYW